MPFETTLQNVSHQLSPTLTMEAQTGLEALETFPTAVKTTFEHEWLKIGHLPDYIAVSECIQANNDEFIVVTGKLWVGHGTYHGIWAYNIYNKHKNFLV